MLSLIKAIKEIDGLDIEHVEKLISIANIIKQQEASAGVEAGSAQPLKKKETSMKVGPEKGGKPPIKK